jgi:hypothetical protein
MIDRSHDDKDNRKKYKGPIKSVVEFNKMLKEIKEDTANIRDDIVEE